MASPSNNLLLVANLLQVTNNLQVLQSLEVPNDLLGPLGTVGTPTFSPAAGTYTSAQSVTIASANATVIYYTTDGSTPTNPPTGTSTLYTGAISVSVSETLQAIGGAPDWSNSAVGSAAYVINLGPSNGLFASNTFSGSPQNVAINVAVGDYVIVTVSSNTSCVISDNGAGGGNTYTLIGSNSVGFGSNFIFACKGATVTATQVSSNLSAGLSMAVGTFKNATGVGTPVFTFGNSANLSGSVTTVSNNSIVVGSLAARNAVTVTSGTEQTATSGNSGTLGQVMCTQAVPSSGTIATTSGTHTSDFWYVTSVEVE